MISKGKTSGLCKTGGGGESSGVGGLVGVVGLLEETSGVCLEKKIRATSFIQSFRANDNEVTLSLKNLENHE